MSTSGMVTALPLQITFHHAEPSPDAELWVREEVEKLGHFYPRIMGCRVAIEGATGRREGNPWHIRIDLTVPGGELVIQRERCLSGRVRRTAQAEIRKDTEARRLQKNLHWAIRDAFHSATRRLEDYARRQRGDVKHPEARPAATVARIFRDQGYGFLTTPDGREIYFHKDSVLNRAFGRLEVGATVTFAEESGEKGPQATSVHIVGRQGPRGKDNLSGA